MNTTGWINALYKEVHIMPKGNFLLSFKNFVCPKSCPSTTEDFCSRSRHAKKITTGIYLIFRGLFFEHNPREIGSAFHRAGAETCPPPADWAKRPFMDGHELVPKDPEKMSEYYS